MLGILVSQHLGEGTKSRVQAHAPLSNPHARRLIGVFNILAWLPVVALALKKAV
jgi:hypothetical protein